MSLLNIAILFSGEGTTLQNLIDATRDGRLPDVTVVKAISSRENAGGIARCAAADVPCVVVPKKDSPDPADHTRAVFAHLPPDEVDLVCCAGWMSRLVLEEPWLSNRVMNVHPSLLPAFGGVGMYGNRVHEAVLARGCKVTGCTVHYVNNEVDGGPIISQTVVSVIDGMTPKALSAAVQVAERTAYGQAVASYAPGHASLTTPTPAVSAGPGGISEGASEEEQRTIRRGVSAAGEAFAPPHGWQPLQLVLRSDDGTLLGGLLGSTLWDWLQVDFLWVAEHARGRGHGEALMARAEAVAHARGCRAARTDTFSFGARRFYEKLGYRVYGELDSFPTGHSHLHLSKRLRATGRAT